ncbi:MAG: hypothetical protein K0S18_1262 [Anaerocolumna sp.]|jgi:hypothetical protein|nr:hypothetical protein [Anaerocolumna sp.]
MGSSSMLPRITVFVLFLIISVVFISRVSLATKEDKNTNVTINNQETQNDQLNEAENVILNMLLSAVSDSNNQSEANSYETFLVNYLSSNEIEFSMSTAEKVRFQLNDMIALRNLENESDIRKMSLDGRGVAIHINQQIYELCGLRLDYNIFGEVKQLEDPKGNCLYKDISPVIRDVFDVNTAMIILAVWLSLLNLCIFIAKKNQLYIKDGEYEFNKKGFAQ